MNARCGSLRCSQLQGLNLPFQISLPSCKSPMFQPAGAALSLDLKRRQSTPFLGSPSCPRLPARLRAPARGHAAVKQAPREQRLLGFTAVTSGDGAESSPCTLIALRRWPSRPPCEPASPRWGRSTRPYSSHPPSCGFFLSPSHLSTPRGSTPQPTASPHFPPRRRRISRGPSFPPTTESRESAPRGRGSFRISQAPPTPAARVQ